MLSRRLGKDEDEATSLQAERLCGVYCCNCLCGCSGGGWKACKIAGLDILNCSWGRSIF